MNFLEAYSALDQLNYSLLQYRIPPKFNFSAVKGVCPGCGGHFKTKCDYEQHVIKHCEDAQKIFAANEMPARVKMGKAGRSFDVLVNITEEELIDYMIKHRTCEICGAVGVHPDHKHAKDGTPSGTFRGAICRDCNLLLGRLESEFGGLSYDDYLLKIKNYLDRGEEWADPAKARFNQPDLNYAEYNF